MAFYSLAVDFGSKYFSIAIIGQNRVVKEPSVVAYSLKENKYLGFGYKALELYKENKNEVKLIHPYEDGEIKDKDSAAMLIREMWHAVVPTGVYEHQIDATIAVPIGTTTAAMKKMEKVFLNAGISPVRFTESILSAAAYTFNQFKVNSGIMVNYGYEKTEIALIEDNKILDGCTVYIGGKYIDVGMTYVMEDKFFLAVNTDEAGEIKEKCVSFNHTDVSTAVAQGISINDGRVKQVRVAARDFYDVLAENTERIALVVNSIYNGVEADKLRDIKANGVFIVGGCSKIYGIDTFFSNIINVPVRIPNDSECAVILGVE